VTAWWKKNRDWMGAADILRLDSADPAILAEQQQARDGSRFVVFAGRLHASAQIANRPLRLTALDAQARYRVTLLNAGDATSASRGPVALKDGSASISGAALMGAGLQLPISFPDSIWVLEGERIS
jgi:alpha-galactosidase